MSRSRISSSLPESNKEARKFREYLKRPSIASVAVIRLYYSSYMIPYFSSFIISAIHLDVPCKVCGDLSTGMHFGVYACDTCSGFFLRSIRRNRFYVCKFIPSDQCQISKTTRNQCRACRMSKCLEVGMIPRLSTRPRKFTLQSIYIADPAMNHDEALVLIPLAMRRHSQPLTERSK